jgi:D-alanyl-D-alanine carboxypeptidase
MASTQPVPLPSSTFDAEQYSLDDPASPWVVVNKARPVSLLKYIPDDLVQVEGVTFADGGSMRREAADALADMKTAAGNAGVTFTVSSAFRDYARQSNLYSDYVSDSGVGRADRFSARPGYSEHQTGWAADLYDSTTCRLKACYGASESGKWVADHAAEYGFIVRYPEGKEAVTGYKYEPWHVRYVGMSLAERMRDEGVQTLEEFFGLPDAPAYQ